MADSRHDMPTHAELAASSASVAFPHSCTNGVPHSEFKRYGMTVLHLFQKHRLPFDHYPLGEGCESRFEEVYRAIESTYRIIDSSSSGDLVRDGILQPYCKVIYQSLPHSPIVFDIYLCLLCV